MTLFASSSAGSAVVAILIVLGDWEARGGVLAVRDALPSHQRSWLSANRWLW